MKNKNTIVSTLIVAILVGAGSFYAGMLYQKNQPINTEGKQFIVSDSNGQRLQKGDVAMGVSTLGKGQSRPVGGEIISQDDKSITIKMQDGSTKIIILPDKTTINKTAEGTKSDLTTGERVVVLGAENADGSITAQNIQLGAQLRIGQPKISQIPNQ